MPVSSILSKRGSVAHFLIGEGLSSGVKTSDARDERLPLGELPYPLEIDIWRFEKVLSVSPWMNSLDFGREDDFDLGAGTILLVTGGVRVVAGTEIERPFFFPGTEGSCSSGIGVSLS